MDTRSDMDAEPGKAAEEQKPAIPPPLHHPLWPGLRSSSTSPQGPPASPRSWSDVLCAPRTTRVPDSEMIKSFILFLNTYSIRGANVLAYRAQVDSLPRGGMLQIHFAHLLDSLRRDGARGGFLDLVLRIGNDASHEWLVPAVQDLMMQHFPGNVTEEMKKSARVTFLDKPNSIARLKDFLSDKSNPPAKVIRVVAGRSSIYASTTRGRTAFRVPLVNLISLFRKDQWFEGDFSIEHFLIVNSEYCYIWKMPTSLCELSHRSSDLAKKQMAEGKARNLESLWNIMKEFYTKDGQLAVYFESLEYDLNDGAKVLVTKEWFLMYLAYHFAFASSMCRKNLTCESYQVCKNHSLDEDSAFKVVLLSKLSQDWRFVISRSDDYILKRCFLHGIISSDEEHKQKNELIKLGQFEKVNLLPFVNYHHNTIAGVLEYKRNLLQHLVEGLKKEMKMRKKQQAVQGQRRLTATVQESDIKDIDEIELFASDILPEVEPVLLKLVMEKRPKVFESVLSCYQASIHDKKDLPIQRTF